MWQRSSFMPFLPLSVCKRSQANLFAGLGFEDCSAKITQVSDSELTQQNPYLKEHETVPAKGWAFYTFNVTQEDYQVVVNVAGEQDSPCEAQAPHSHKQLFPACMPPPNMTD